MIFDQSNSNFMTFVGQFTVLLCLVGLIKISFKTEIRVSFCIGVIVFACLLYTEETFHAPKLLSLRHCDLNCTVYLWLISLHIGKLDAMT